MAIEVKDGEQLSKVLDDFNKRIADSEARIAELKDADGPGAHEKLEKELKALQEQANEIARKRIPVEREEDGKRVRVSPRELRSLGVKALHNARTVCQRNFGKTGAETFSEPEGDVAEWQEASDILLTAKTVSGWSEAQARKSSIFEDLYRPAYEKVAARFKETFDTAGSGLGSEWVGAEYSSRLFEKTRLMLRVLDGIEVIQMPRSPYVYPVQLADLKVFSFSQQTTSPTTLTGVGAMTDMTASQTITGNVTFTGRGIGGIVFMTKFAEEDSYVPLRAFLNQNAPQGLANGLEHWAINGDSTATHQDADINAITGDVAKLSIGFRKAARTFTADVDAQGNKINTSANWRSYVMQAKGLMGKYGVPGQPLKLIVSPQGYNQLLSVEDFSTAASLAGGSGTNVAGDFRFRPYGMEVVASEFMKENLANTGVNAGLGADNFTGMVIVNLNAWKLGVLRNVTVQLLSEQFAQWDMNALLLTWRGDFQSPYGVTGSVNHTGYIYDIGL